MEIVKLSKEEFNSFIRDAKNTSLYQTSEYGLTMSKQGYQELFVGLKHQENIIAAALILIKNRFGFKYGYCPRGFIIDYNDYDLLEIWTKLLKRFLQDYRVVAIKLCPPIKTDQENELIIINQLKKLGYYHFGYNNYFEALKPRFEAYINLDTSIDQLFFNIKKEYRTKIRSAHNHGIIIHKGELEDLVILHNQTKRKYIRDLKYYHELYQQFKSTASIDIFYAQFNTQDFLEKTKEEYEQIEKESDSINHQVLEEKMNSNSFIEKKMTIDKKLSFLKEKLIEARKINNTFPNNINLASALIITHKEEAYLLIDGLNEKFKTFNAKHLLIWKLIENYHSLGYKIFNLGGMVNPKIENNKFSGLNQFKLSFNAQKIEYLGDFELIINKSHYFIFSKTNPISKILKK